MRATLLWRRRLQQCFNMLEIKKYVKPLKLVYVYWDEGNKMGGKAFEGYRDSKALLG